MTPTISLAMIVRDEEANLALCLNSLKEEVDEIVVVDTGSRDGTLNIAADFTDKIYSYEWSNDFSAARNFAISKCTGHWIISLDADEKLDSQAGSLRQLFNRNPEAEVFLLPLLLCADEKCERFSVIRLFRNTAAYRFAGKIHEQVVIMNAKVVGVADAPVILHKFITGKERNKKRYRNLKLLRQAINSEPDNYYLKYYLGVTWLGMGRYEKALPYFQEAVANIGLDRLMFRGPAIRYLVNCLRFCGRLDDALGVCHNECKLNPNYTDIFFDAGAILAERGEFKQAIEYFHKAIQLGTPPLLFYHSQGTESFLAFYHLAFCYEKIGCYELAEGYCWQALTVNPNYVCPLYNLFVWKATNLPAPEIFLYFKNKNSLVHEQWVEILATLFLDMGLPGLAAQCYEQSLTLSANISLKRIKSLLYSGCVQEAQKMVSGSENGKFSPDIAIEEIIAHIVNADYHTAKQRALRLWIHSPASRSKAWALLAIIARSSLASGYTKPEKSRETEITQTYLSILESCLHLKQKCPGVIPASATFEKLTTTIVGMLAESSAESNIHLADFFQRKAGEIRSLLDYKYRAARGLYV
ncbi:glycosyltransferase [Pelosinus sp. UFO1]|uniref:glycosyltransferase n=1 Tax=Pelosinus sp. UFO1 TaxID=484770 RepID=UPI0004D11BB3|nr:glycosyltransferase [Pelosinus sp. UFO1]AIF50655.1 glycosyl transferase family 2 [Pelosinus sp. UFO1]